MPTVYFMRHGFSEGNTTQDTGPVSHDHPLTEEGVEQARRAAAYFSENDIVISRVYSSPLIRAKQTADIVARTLSVTTEVKDGLKERDWGEWNERDWETIKEYLDTLPIKERYVFAPPGAESWQQLERRVCETFDSILSESVSLENILIVGHRGSLRALTTAKFSSLERHKEHTLETGGLARFVVDTNEFEILEL